MKRTRISVKDKMQIRALLRKQVAQADIRKLFEKKDYSYHFVEHEIFLYQLRKKYPLTSIWLSLFIIYAISGVLILTLFGVFGSVERAAIVLIIASFLSVLVIEIFHPSASEEKLRMNYTYYRTLVVYTQYAILLAIGFFLLLHSGWELPRQPLSGLGLIAWWVAYPFVWIGPQVTGCFVIIFSQLAFFQTRAKYEEICILNEIKE